MKIAAVRNFFSSVQSTASSIFAVAGRSGWASLPCVGTGYASAGNGGTRVWALVEGRSLTLRIRGLEIVVDRRTGTPAWCAWPVLIVATFGMFIFWPEHFASTWRELSRDPEPATNGAGWDDPADAQLTAA